MAVLIAGIALDGVVLYYPVDAAPRLIVGLLLIPIILWAGTRLEIQEALAAHTATMGRGRVFRELRSQVVLLLEQVRRLNWIAVDAERGFRNREDAVREMDAIENEIRDIVTDVRAAAGKPTAEPETSLIESSDAVG